MGVLGTRLRALYGGRHGRTTAVLATTSAAAGALTGIVGIGVAGTPVSHDTPAPTSTVKAVKPRHHASTAPAKPFVYTRPTRSHSPSPTPTATATHTAVAPTPSGTPTASSTPTAPASSPPPSSDPTTAPPAASPPG